MNTQPSELPSVSEQTLVDEEHPWPGLASFRERDEHYFKGREPDIEKLYTLVSRERLTVLFGVSGLGKSSLLQAGLFPRLRQENIFPVYIRLDFVAKAMPLSEQVFSAIAQQALAKAIEVPARTGQETLWEYFHRKDAEFWDTRNRIMIPLLCFDQFEEIFTLGRENQQRTQEVRQFVTELANLVEGRCPDAIKAHLDNHSDEAKVFSFTRHPYKVVLGLREDYLADLEGLRKEMPSLIHNRLRLMPMNGDQALAVADQTQGRLMETSVAESIVRVVAGKQGETSVALTELRIEPALLSLVCRELNERRIANNTKQIDAHAVASNREQILENFYARSLENESPELHSFIEDKLITLNGFRNSEAYDNALGTPAITPEALSRLVQQRLIRLEERDGVKRIELIHDVLTGVVRKNRDQRWLLEKQQQAEAERKKAEEAFRTSKRRALVYLAMMSIALCTSLWGWWSWWDAQQAQIKVQQALKTANHALVVTDFREAHHQIENRRLSDALAYLARSVRVDPEWLSNRSLLMSLLQQRKWFLPQVTLEHNGAVTSAVFSADGTRVLTASWDNTVQLWDARTGQSLGEPMQHEGIVTSAVFSADGARVLTVSWGGARLWDVLPVLSDSQHLLAQLAEGVARQKLNEFSTMEKLEDPVRQLNQLRQQTAQAPLGESTAESFVRWFLSDPWARSISPLSRLTVPDYIQQQIAAGRREQVEKEFPGHPLLH